MEKKEKIEYIIIIESDRENVDFKLLDKALRKFDENYDLTTFEKRQKSLVSKMFQ